MYSVVTGAQAEGSLIPKAVAMETATEEAKVTVPVVGVIEGTTPKMEAAVTLRLWWRHMSMS
jgi:hypothetical protein